MHSYTVTNVNTALPSMLAELKLFGIRQDTRNGPVLRFGEPVAITYKNSTQRVLFDPTRNANPFFHFFESLWMLAGRNDVAFVAQFVKRMREYSDDGAVFHGAYGFRWREHFGYDQLSAVIDELTVSNNSRRAVLAMWDATDGGLMLNDDKGGDLGAAANDGKDVPCNTHIYFEIIDNRLNMTVCNRSNDMLWGALGANVVHMSMLQEYMANAMRITVGDYVQFSNNMHVYTDVLPLNKFDQYEPCNMYAGIDPANLLPLIGLNETYADFDDDLAQFFSVYELHGKVDCGVEYVTEYFNKVVDPMAATWLARNDANEWAEAVDNIGTADWRLAVEAWLSRRALARDKA